MLHFRFFSVGRHAEARASHEVDRRNEDFLPACDPLSCDTDSTIGTPETSVLDQTTHLCNSGDCAPKPAKQGECFQFSNDLGVKEIRVGVRAFECIGETPPQDHPHVYLELGEHNQILCPYCSTLFRFDTGLRNV